MSFFSKIVEAVAQPETPAQAYVRHLKAAILRNESRRHELEESVAGTCPCCVSAALGGCGSEYDLLCKKADRQEAELRRMEAKLRR